MLVCGLRHINDQHILAGWTHSPTGIAPWKFDTTTRPGLELMKFQAYKPSFIDAADNIHMVFRGGVFDFGLQGDETSTELVALPSGRRFQNHEVYHTQNVEESVQDLLDSGFFARDFVGDRIALTWNMNTDAEFDSYLLYWDQGLGGAVDTLLATIPYRGETEYITASLSAGTYVYWLKFKDYLGNTGASPSDDPGEQISVVLVAPPTAPTIVGNSWDAPSRKYSVEATTTSDGIVFYSNWIAGEPTLLNYVHYEHRLPMSQVGDVFTTHELGQGDWILHIHSVTDAGILSDPQIITFKLQDESGTLTEVTKVAPLDFIQAELQSGADIKLTWNPTGVTVELYVSTDGGSSYALESTETGTSYTYSGVDATEYYFKARVKETQGLNTVYSEYTDAISATADGAAPTGSQELTAEIL